VRRGSVTHAASAAAHGHATATDDGAHGQPAADSAATDDGANGQPPADAIAD
jgi:hypothetical protein